MAYKKGSNSWIVNNWLALVVLAVIAYAVIEWNTIKTWLAGLPLIGGLFGPSKDQQYYDGKAKDINHIKVSSAGMTFSQQTAITMADTLMNCMYKGYPLVSADLDGTDTEGIYNVFSRIRTPDDMKAVYKAFGVRVYVKYIGGSDDEGDLNYWLTKELSDSELAQIQDKLNWI